MANTICRPSSLFGVMSPCLQIVSLLASLAFGSCKSEKETTERDVQSQQQAELLNEKNGPTKEFMDNPFLFETSDDFGFDYPELGSPLSLIEHENTEITDKSQFTFERKLTFDGLEIFVGTNSKTLPVYRIISVSSSKILLKNGLHIGSSVQQVVDSLGQPDRRSSSRIDYESEDNLRHLSFSIDRDAVKKVIWMDNL